jgi:electron transfer flavoprotein alpha subunit
MDYSGVWILAEQSKGRVQRISHELLTRGRELADKLSPRDPSGRKGKLTALIFGHQIEQADLQELIDRGADAVLAVEAPELEHFLPEPYAACMLRLIAERRPEIIIAGATSTGRGSARWFLAGPPAGAPAWSSGGGPSPSAGGVWAS